MYSMYTKCINQLLDGTCTCVSSVVSRIRQVFYQTLPLTDCNTDSIKISICLLLITKQEKVSLNHYIEEVFFRKEGF